MADRISALPDSILHHILSLMPTKQVVNTSVLSKRWGDLWLGVPNINIDDSDLMKFVKEENDASIPIEPRVTSFLKFAERVLILRGQSSLKKVSLGSDGLATPGQIHSWISGAIAHNVQELDLSFMLHCPSVVSWSILNWSTSLVSLSICRHAPVEVGELPCHISFPCLKTLFLRFVQFPNGNSMRKLLSGCPVLEELFLLDCMGEGGKFILSSSSLKSLRIDNPVFCGRRSINAANLKSFQYYGCLSDKIFLNNASSWAEVSINIETPEKRKKRAASRVVDLLKDLKDNVSLRLCNWTIESLKFADNMQEVSFPKLIRVTLVTTEIKNYTFGALVDLLSLCPVLESICFSEGLNLDTRSDWSSIPLPCMKSCLKRLSLEKFRGYKSEVCFLKWVLKNACVLERMDIWRSETYGNNLKKKKTKTMVELLKADRSSGTCVIKFF